MIEGSVRLRIWSDLGVNRIKEFTGLRSGQD